jgi:archaellum component FlaG (FlaF/FlaG flagellin family)
VITHISFQKGEGIMKKSTFVILMLLLMGVISGLPFAASAIEPKIIVTNPVSHDSNFIFYTNTTAVGTRFNATVWLYNVTDLWAYEVKLYVNDTLLNITRAWRPTWDSHWVFYGKSTVGLIPSFYDLDHNGRSESVLVGDSMLSGTSFTGSGLLAVIEFQIMYAPSKGNVSCNLAIDNVDTSLLNSNLDEISAIKINGFYKYVGPPPPPIPKATMYIEPDKIVDPTLVPCNYFRVNVSIANATGVYSFNFKLGYDVTTITVKNATLGSFFPPSATFQVFIDNVAGYISFSAVLTPPNPPVSGDGVLAIITFHVEGVGASNLHLYDFGIFDQSSGRLPCEAKDGFFTNIKMAKLYIEPPKIVDPNLKPSAIFSVDVMIDDVEDLYGYEFKLGYNTHMLTCIGILVHPILGETRFSTIMHVDDYSGLIFVKVQYRSPAVPITTFTPEAIVTLTFMVDNIGSSPLHLYDTNITDPNQNPIEHEATDGFVMTLIRDVAVVNITLSSNSVFERSMVNITVTVKNLGNISETFDVKAYYNSSLIGTQQVVDLNPNIEESLLFKWNTTGVTPGIYTIKGEASQVPDEFNITNNVYIDGSIEIKKLIRDVAVVSVSAAPTIVYQGENVNITVTVKNKGNLTETFNVSIYYGTSEIGIVNIKNLIPNGELTFMYVWNTQSFHPCTNYTISAEASAVPDETNLADNYLADGHVKIKMPGDINGDGKVDIKDVAIVAAAFGSFPGHPKWNPVADLYKDGKIDIRDVAIVARNFGKIC